MVRITNDLEKIIGKGGFGKVYKGTLKNGKAVAVKIKSEDSEQGMLTNLQINAV